MGSVNKCDLFIVGEQKAGTTYLYNYLRQHPEVCMSVVKEPGYFCKDLIEDSIEFHGENLYYDYTNLKKYHDLFKDFSKKVVGEATSVYLYSKKAAQEIYQYNPNAKILIMLREPISFLYSLHSQYLKETTEDIEEFMEAYQLYSQRKKGEKIPRRVRSPSLVFYKDRIKYDRNIKRYLDHFDKDQLKIIIFEKFIKNNQKYLNEIMRFLDIDQNINISVNKTNPHRVPKNKLIFHTLHNPKLKKIIKDILPDKTFQSFKNIFNNLFLEKQERKKLSKNNKNKLKREIKPEVKKLQKLFKQKILVDTNLTDLWEYDL
jgi:hypothetical protein